MFFQILINGFNPSCVFEGRPPKRKFSITFEILIQSTWNFASVNKILIVNFWKNFVIIDDVIASQWRHHLLKMPKIGPPSNFFSHAYFLLKFPMAAPYDMCVFCRPVQICPFCPILGPNFYISGLKQAIDLNFGPKTGIDNRSLLSKFERNRKSSCTESEQFRWNTDRSVKYQPGDWLTWNFAHHLIWSRSITGQNFKSKAPVVPLFR